MLMGSARRRAITWSALSIALAAATVPAAAEAQSVADDVRCLMVSNVFAKAATEAKAKQIAQSAKLFYGGRASQLSMGDLKEAMAAQQARIDAANAGETMKACAQAMDKSLKSIQSAGQGVQAQSK